MTEEKISYTKQRAIWQIEFLRKPPIRDEDFVWAWIDLNAIIRDHGFTFEELGFTEEEFAQFEREAKAKSRKRFEEAQKRRK
ncbi:hypothetical protein KJ885_02035 [Patescibacteria group bacterium]|nr:hypothetical protein [Patescibacteria group bacterium]